MNSETVEMLIQKKIKTENFSWVYATQLYGNKASVPKDEISVYNEDTKKYLIFKLTQGEILHVNNQRRWLRTAN